MEAKDTVLNIEAIQALLAGQIIDSNYLYEDINRLCKQVAQAQAEISFPAGIKEVVEWIKQYSLVDPTDPTLYKSFRMEWEDWQAKLKEWGIE